MAIEDEVLAAHTVRLSTEIGEEPVLRAFLQGTEYFPVTRRQMKQSWRLLRRMVREGPSEELDIAATVEKLGREGVLLEFVRVPKRVNRAALLLLVDHGGSMVPFQPLSSRLIETALRAGHFGGAGAFYFHDCPHWPDQYLYHEPARRNAVKIAEVLEETHTDRTSCLIFSDAGAARGHLDLERVAMTERFLGTLKSQIRHVAWLNPMPRGRWSGTTASDIARLVPMFELSRRGVHGAIAALRGRLFKTVPPRSQTPIPPGP